jgi:hypothetical protein
LPFLRARIELERLGAIDGKFELDSGGTGAVAFNTPFVNKYKLLSFVSKTTQSRIGGVGGTAQTFSGRLKSLQLGGFELKDSVARFSRSTRGDSASAKYDGLIGGEIFRRFKVIFDYSRRQMILEPNERFAEPYEVDMSGLEIGAEGNDFSVAVVNEVEKDSPAAQAGIKAEDIITAIDGRSTAGSTLDQIRRQFMEDGRTYQLSLKRGKKVLETKLILKRSI